MSTSGNQNAPRASEGEEGGFPWGKLLLAILGVLLLILLLFGACQAFGGGGQEGAAPPGDGEQQDQGDQARQEPTQEDEAQQGAAQEGTEEETGAEAPAGDPEAGEATGGEPAEGEAAEGESAEGEQAASAPAGAAGAVEAELAGIEAQSGDGTTVTVPQATIAGTDGWIAVHRDANGRPQVPESVGQAPIQEGENTGVVVPLDEPVGTETLYAMIHADDPADGVYTFPDGDPPVERDGEPVVEPFEYTADPALAAGEAAGEGEVAQYGDASAGEAGPAEDALPDSGGPAVLLLAGAAFLILGSALQALRLRD